MCTEHNVEEPCAAHLTAGDMLDRLHYRYLSHNVLLACAPTAFFSQLRQGRATFLDVIAVIAVARSGISRVEFVDGRSPSRESWRNRADFIPRGIIPSCQREKV